MGKSFCPSAKDKKPLKNHTLAVAPGAIISLEYSK